MRVSDAGHDCNLSQLTFEDTLPLQLRGIRPGCKQLVELLLVHLARRAEVVGPIDRPARGGRHDARRCGVGLSVRLARELGRVRAEHLGMLGDGRGGLGVGGLSGEVRGGGGGLRGEIGGGVEC